MSIKKMISISLLSFVLFSIAFLVYKETAHKGKERNTVNEARTFTVTEAQKSEPIRENISKEITPKPQKAAQSVPPAPEAKNAKIIAYYFHGTYRCHTCLNIEKYSYEAIEKYFSKELQNKTLEFKPVNVEEPENRHYVQDYQLFTKSLVIAIHKDKKQVKWKNLADVWTYVNDKEKFYQYVKDEIEKLLKEMP